MSLDALVAEAGQVLGDARGLYGPAAVSGGWSSTAGLGVGRDGLAQAGDVLKGWGGASSSTQHAQSGGRVAALDNVIGADRGTASGFDGAARNSQSGRSGMDGVVDDTRRGVTAIAPSTDTPAGKTQMVEHLRSQLDRAKDLLRVSEQRNALLANAIRNSSGGYGMPARGMGGGGMPGMGMPTGLPMMSGGGGGGGLSSLGGSGLIPNLSAFTRPNNRMLNGPLAPATTVGGGPLAQTAVKSALSKRGTAYVWGAKGPNNFDCSGLTQWAWRQAGVTLGPNTYTQVTQGAGVPPGQVQAGDLIFPKGPGYTWDAEGPGHVMMAISPTEVVHAPQTGDVVKVSPMPAAYVARRPVAA
ncbi:C40 family peptidase [Mycobacteroides abscessus]|uniref:C40 family peptidase n=1 Tax=Mycobacteroides abscessus TaxID=36809 RepID=UPI0009A85979|nr:C40 family peptidase [Mycobacteroides abscessus]